MEAGNRDGILRRTQPAIAGSEDKGRSPGQECKKPLEAGEDKVTEFPLNPPEKNTALLTP